MREKLYHMGIRGKVSRNTLADANENRDWRIYSDFAQILIHEARRLYVDDDFGLELKETVYALDSSTIDLCLIGFSLGTISKTKAAVNCIPCWIFVVISRRSFGSPMVRFTTSMCLII
jgi:hypothetical protein